MLLEDASGTAATGKEKGAGLGGLAWKHSIYLMLKPARASSPSRLPQVQNARGSALVQLAWRRQRRHART